MRKWIFFVGKFSISTLFRPKWNVAFAKAQNPSSESDHDDDDKMMMMIVTYA